MTLYTIIEAIIAVVAGILLAVCSKKTDGVSYNKLDKAGRITNIFLLPVYLCAMPVCMFLGMLCLPNYDGFLGILGWIISIIAASAALSCGLGLGFSVVLRKKGRSRLSFAIQFMGIIGIVLTFLLYMIFAGNLLSSLN